MSFLGAVSVCLQPCVHGRGGRVAAHNLGAEKTIHAVSIYAMRWPTVCADRVPTSTVNGVELTSAVLWYPRLPE